MANDIFVAVPLGLNGLTAYSSYKMKASIMTIAKCIYGIKTSDPTLRAFYI